jgi:hypothetical protein
MVRGPQEGCARPNSVIRTSISARAHREAARVPAGDRTASRRRWDHLGGRGDLLSRTASCLPDVNVVVTGRLLHVCVDGTIVKTLGRQTDKPIHQIQAHKTTRRSTASAA